MGGRPTAKDVAREAGVSLATVDRALNGRVKVREETLRAIAEAAHRLGYHARGLIEHRLGGVVPEVRLGFILLKERQEYYQNFAREIAQAVAARADIRGRAVIRFARSQSPEEFAELLESLGARVDAVACVAVNHQKLDRVVEDLRRGGVPTFSVLNDFAQGIRRNYIGLNNLKVGRVAAWMLTRPARPGKLAVFVGGNRWHGQDLREIGFRGFVREGAPDFRVLDTIVNLESRRFTREATLDLLGRHPDLAGIYVAGGGMEGAISALREVVAPGQVPLVVNELTAESRAALCDGYATMAIATPLPRLCADLVGLMISATREADAVTVEQHFLEPRVVLPDMV